MKDYTVVSRWAAFKSKISEFRAELGKLASGWKTIPTGNFRSISEILLATVFGGRKAIAAVGILSVKMT